MNKLTIKINTDEHVEYPAEFSNTELFLVANHRQFYVPEPGEKRVPNTADELICKYKKTHWIFHLEAYIHGGVVLALSGEGNFPDRDWDVSQLGLIFAAKSEWRFNKEARKAAISLVDTWNKYLSNDVWYWEILNDNGEILESCSGCYGFEYAKSEATACAKHYESKQ